MQALNVSPGYDQLPSCSKLVDGYGRTINYLRLEVTDRCNLRCRYCMPMKGISPGRGNDILSVEKIIRLVDENLSL